FVSSEGKGWTGRFDAETRLVHRAYGPPIELDILPQSGLAGLRSPSIEFINNHRDLFGVGEGDLELAGVRHLGGIWYLDFSQVCNGVPVVGGRVLMRVTDEGRLMMFGAETYPDVHSNTDPKIGSDGALMLAMEEVSFKSGVDEQVGHRLVILPQSSGGSRLFRLCWEVRLRTHEPPGNWFIYVSAEDGTIVKKMNRLWSFSVYGKVTGEVLPQFLGDTPVDMSFAHELVKVIGLDSTATDTWGDYTISVGNGGSYRVSSMLCGDYVEVMNEDGPEASHIDSANTNEPHDWTWRAPSDGLPDEMNVYYHVNRIHDWFRSPPFNFGEMDYRMKATVRYGTNYSNAFYNGRDIYFGEGGSGGMRNLALFSDVIYHEYAHGVTDRIYHTQGEMQFEAMMEGFSDYVAATLNNDPLLGNGGLYQNRPYARSLYNDLRFPDDFGMSPHHDGQIIAGAVWDLRSYEGAALADSLWFYALHGEPLTFEDFLLEVLLADDNNGDLSNGTPHDCAIYQAFGRHGLGPGVCFTVEHTPRKDSEGTEKPYPVYAKVRSKERIPPVKLWYLGFPFVEYSCTRMERTENPDEYVGEIPPQPSGTFVKYYMQVGCVRLPSGAPDWDAFSFYVGPDTVPPEIVHYRLPDRAIEAWPPIINAEITDNLAIRPSPCVMYRINGVSNEPLDMAKVPGADIYYAEMGADVSVCDLVEYRIVAHDSSHSANVAYAPSDTSYYSFRICKGFFDDMENGPDGWTHATTPGYVDEWRMTSRRHLGGVDSVAWGCGQEGGDYSNLNHSMLVSPIINVDFDARLIFWHRMDAETLDFWRAFDGGVVEVSRDSGKTWEHVVPNGGYNCFILPGQVNPIREGTYCYSGSFDWRLAEFNLAAFYGNIQIRFRFGSDENTTAEGWYIDDVEVINCPETGVLETRRVGGRP
ncbi:MAG: M36 family metallopeptidase, partial [bacterium]